MPEPKKESGAHKATKDNFDQLINGEKPVLVDFYASWCGPCQMMLPIVIEIAKDNKHQNFEVMTVDIDDLPDVAARYNVMSVPTFMVFKDGKEVARMLGSMPKDLLVSRVNEAIK